MSDKSVLVASLAGSEVWLHGGFRGGLKPGLHVETQPVGLAKPSRRSVSVWSLTFPSREVADQVFLIFFGLTIEDAIRLDRRRKVIKGDNALKIKAAESA